jgi:hypothetical protein
MTIQGPLPLHDPGAPILTTTPIETPSRIGPQTPDGPLPAAKASVSPWSALLSRLQQAQQSNPAEFKRLAGRLANAVDTEAAKAAGDEAKSLSKLGDQLKVVAKTGDLSVFKPTHHPRHARAQPMGGAPSFLQTLLQQIDHVLGPGANPQ